MNPNLEKNLKEMVMDFACEVVEHKRKVFTKD